MLINEKAFDATVNDLPESLKNLFRKRLEEYEAAKTQQPVGLSDRLSAIWDAFSWVSSVYAEQNSGTDGEYFERGLSVSKATIRRSQQALSDLVKLLNHDLPSTPKRESIAHEWKATPEVLTTPIKCLLCDDEAVVIVHAPQGCICSPNKYQPRCMQHLMRASDTDEEISVVEDFRIPLSKIEDQGGVRGWLMTNKRFHLCVYIGSRHCAVCLKKKPSKFFERICKLWKR